MQGYGAGAAALDLPLGHGAWGSTRVVVMEGQGHSARGTALVR